MKYDFAKPTATKTFKLPNFEGGINFSNAFKKIDDQQLINSKNLEYSNYKLEGRKGLFCDYDSLLDISAYTTAEKIDYSITNTEVILEGEKYKIAKADIIHDSNHRFTCFYAIAKNGFVKKLGFIHFGRVDDSTFYVPENVTVFCGKPCFGKGIFALVTTYNLNNQNQKEYYIYEAPTTFTEWSICTDEYIPTVYINGRGASYEEAKAANFASNLAPREIESPNLLNGNFYSYYTSDGFSSCFRLPYTKISNSVIRCRLFITPDKQVIWTIKANETTASATVEDKNVTLTVDRSKGIVYFKSENANFPIAKMNLYPNNNIRIFASIDTSDKLKEIVSCTQVVKHKDLIVFSGGISKSKIYYSRSESPLYFREFIGSTIGDNISEITAMISVGNRIIAFKKNSVYSVTASLSKNINSTQLLIDNDNIFYEANDFKIECINNQIGADNHNQISCINNNLLWFIGGKINYLNTSSKNIINISQNIENYIEENFNNTAPISLAYYNSKAILTNKNKAIIINFNENANTISSKNTTCFIWEFPSQVEIQGVTFLENGFIFVCKNKDMLFGFAGILKGSTDYYATGTKISVKIVAEPIDFSFETKYYNLGEFDEKYILNSGLVLLSSTGYTQIELNTDKSQVNYVLKDGYNLSKEQKPLELKVGLKPTKTLSMKINSTGEFSYLDARFNYTMLKN